MSRPGVRSTDGLSRRRIATRRRLIDAALEVFADRGIDAATVQQITDAAGVGFGTFYNYFDSKEQAVEAVYATHVDTMGERIEATLAHVDDPAAKVACATRHALLTMRQRPTWARFMQRAEVQRSDRVSLLLLHMAQDVGAGVDQGRFRAGDAEAMLLVCAGILTSFGIAETRGMLPEDGSERAARETLLYLGLDPEEAEALSRLPLGELSPTAE